LAKVTLSVSKIVEGKPERVEIEGKGVLIARVGNNFYAIGDKCTHMGCSLSEGTLEDTTITCGVVA
jgi:nitrite reductase/ring-hydroxylating ferredoxin subunit